MPSIKVRSISGSSQAAVSHELVGAEPGSPFPKHSAPCTGWRRDEDSQGGGAHVHCKPSLFLSDLSFRTWLWLNPGELPLHPLPCRRACSRELPVPDPSVSERCDPSRGGKAAAGGRRLPARPWLLLSLPNQRRNVSGRELLLDKLLCAPLWLRERFLHEPSVGVMPGKARRVPQRIGVSWRSGASSGPVTPSCMFWDGPLPPHHPVLGFGCEFGDLWSNGSCCPLLVLVWLVNKERPDPSKKGGSYRRDCGVRASLGFTCP